MSKQIAQVVSSFCCAGVVVIVTATAVDSVVAVVSVAVVVDGSCDGGAANMARHSFAVHLGLAAAASSFWA